MSALELSTLWIASDALPPCELALLRSILRAERAAFAGPRLGELILHVLNLDPCARFTSASASAAGAATVRTPFHIDVLRLFWRGGSGDGPAISLEHCASALGEL